MTHVFGNPPKLSEGSNNWAVSGRLTRSGFPILANDPHRRLQIPSLRYWVHLSAPGWNVIGGGEPALPGISIGHNDHGAWGLTIFSDDQEDLYVYSTDPRNPRRYRYLDGWENMTVATEKIQVKGSRPGRGCAQVHPPWTGPIRRYGKTPGRRPAGGLARGRLRALSGQPANGSGPELAGIQRSLLQEPDPVREHGLGGQGRQHRLAGDGPFPCPEELARPASGSGRRGGTNGRASFRRPSCPIFSTPNQASWPRPIRIISRTATRTRWGISGPTRSAFFGSSRSWAPAGRRASRHG